MDAATENIFEKIRKELKLFEKQEEIIRNIPHEINIDNVMGYIKRKEPGKFKHFLILNLPHLSQSYKKVFTNLQHFYIIRNEIIPLVDKLEDDFEDRWKQHVLIFMWNSCDKTHMLDKNAHKLRIFIQFVHNIIDIVENDNWLETRYFLMLNRNSDKYTEWAKELMDDGMYWMKTHLKMRYSSRKVMCEEKKELTEILEKSSPEKPNKHLGALRREFLSKLIS